MEMVSKWSPPETKIGSANLDKLLRRHVIADCAEANLVCGVLVQTFIDARAEDSYLRREAKGFLISSNFDLWCNLAGLDPEYVRWMGKTAGFLPPEKDCWIQVPETSIKRKRFKKAER